ncbi:haloacid dehalogenase superfamily, subfamily IA, variant 3 with third motif having DD or ED/haloacid dehalogenase superfamily, subfamily IA, variant 1 with third motif having Dx(3-4)D or Dx(3-4)E [Micromonospora rhizosphaerae]|uniref:Haloacid dehalogenase superfamily, subfamily IA, variant 3 with third motif having DD or ED/haloacid dehalogenase superfamily, subfamily IA, variant 1 with third motif having Dx(3-4)D or Dx(3-4)E n=1 Tax=Micromonospora rhizosphaerae TaxID=568872 RepID=A0A1C6SU03_9ACTN|nr:haloacid dehalogenase superfamily, subfamily IA, variant 3 with third motif having DD or ED/haloacid dehalogenase superfamily, subfamily IA, variant 1 with third motif having Dx(3-4)D or Dx(3-4)E [Micromonospora rhizosphaerae]
MHDVPDHAEPPHPSSGADRASTSRRPVEAVLFDFHGTLAQVEEPREWVLAAAAACGVELDRVRATALADRLLTAGRAGGPLPARVPPRLAELWADRDLYPHAHRGAYIGLAETVDAGIDGFADALYERLLVPEGWVPYPDTEAILKALRQAGVKVAVVSNIAFDIRPLFAAWGLDDLVDAYTLSYEVGRCKPDPGIFLRACGMLGVDPERSLMVGDTPADAGAVAAGCAVLVLPAADAGRANGLGAVLDLALPS